MRVRTLASEYLHRPPSAARHATCVLGLLLSTLLSAEAPAAPVGFSAELLEDDGRLFLATFVVDSEELDSHQTLVEVDDFISTVDGVTYSWDYALPDPPPFTAVASFDMDTGQLAAIDTPFIPALGHDSTVNLRLLLDGTWTANTCIPLPTCNPDYLLGTYLIRPVVVPEPSTAALFAAGLLSFGYLTRRCSRRAAAPGFRRPEPHTQD